MVLLEAPKTPEREVAVQSLTQYMPMRAEARAMEAAFLPSFFAPPSSPPHKRHHARRVDGGFALRASWAFHTDPRPGRGVVAPCGPRHSEVGELDDTWLSASGSRMAICFARCGPCLGCASSSFRHIRTGLDFERWASLLCCTGGEAAPAGDRPPLRFATRRRPSFVVLCRDLGRRLRTSLSKGTSGFAAGGKGCDTSALHHRRLGFVPLALLRLLASAWPTLARQRSVSGKERWLCQNATAAWILCFRSRSMPHSWPRGLLPKPITCAAGSRRSSLIGCSGLSPAWTPVMRFVPHRLKRATAPAPST